MKDINISDEGMLAQRHEYGEAAGQTVWCECSGDFTLPEYMPEISKMIKAEGRVIPTGKYIGAERAEFSGSVIYSIIYAGEDGAPYFTTLGCEYEYAVPLGEAVGCSDIEIFDECAIESTSVRPSGPRKLSIKSKIKALPHVVYKKEEDDGHIALLSGAEFERLCKRESVMESTHFESGEFELEESFKIEGASPEAEIIGCEGNVCISELRPNLNGVICRGECECRIYYYDIEAGRRAFLCARKKVHFEKEIMSYHVCDIQNARAYSKIVSADINTEDGTEELSLSLTLNIWGEYICEHEKEYITDIYACGSDSEVEYKNEQIHRGVLCKNANFSCHAQKKLEMEAEGNVCSAVASARVENVSFESDKACITGEINIEALICTASDGSYDYSTENIPMPFKCELPILCNAQKYDTRITPEVTGVRVRAEKDVLSADAELYLSAFVCGIDSIRTVKSAETLEDIKDTEADSVRIYYPDKGESLWSVGKKYGRSISSIARINGLETTAPDKSESLWGLRSLVIK